MRDGGEGGRGEQVSEQGGSKGDCSGQRDGGRGQGAGGRGADSPALALKQSKAKERGTQPRATSLASHPITPLGFEKKQRGKCEDRL